MKSAYKKRAKSGWTTGKSHKKESNSSERIYDRTEISEQTQEVTKPLKSSKKMSSYDRKINNHIKRFRSAKKWLDRHLNSTTENDWVHSINSTYTRRIKELTPLLESYILQEDADKKLIKQIKELLQ